MSSDLLGVAPLGCAASAAMTSGRIKTRFSRKNCPARNCRALKLSCYARLMSDRYRLVALRNEQLVAALIELVRRENDALSDLLAHLAELDERRLYLDLGFTSLFAYCTEALGFCKSSAGRRITAARVCRKYPGAFARVARGELQLSVLSILNQHPSPENATELFEPAAIRATSRSRSCLRVDFRDRMCGI